MRTLYLDCGMGAAGDMLTAALLELVPDQEKFIDKLNHIGIPGVRFTAEKSVKCGITGTHMSVTVDGVEEGEEMHEHHHHHDHECECHHDHEHHHGHHHSGLHDIEHIIFGHLNVPEQVKNDAFQVYKLIAEAESHAHGMPVSEIHFHEVGTMDAVADVTAVCMLMDELMPDEIVVSPVHVGAGQVKCAHGILPVPAPATAHILRGVPIYGGSINGELCTPTGAALLKHFATKFGPMPMMEVKRIGYGMGKKDFPAANCVRAMFGESMSDSTDKIIELNCNVDDMTAEEIGFAAERLFEAGAKDVFTTPIGMKKTRPGTLISVICKVSDKYKMVKTLFKYTTTLGVREEIMNRYVLDRSVENVETPYGTIRCKTASGYGVVRRKYEYDDLAKIAKEKKMSIAELRHALEQ